MSSCNIPPCTPAHHDAGLLPLAHLAYKSSQTTDMVMVEDERLPFGLSEGHADVPQSQKISVDEDGYSADMDTAVVKNMIDMSYYAEEGDVFRARFNDPELMRNELMRNEPMRSYEPIYSHDATPHPLPKFTNAAPAVPRPIPTQKRKGVFEDAHNAICGSDTELMGVSDIFSDDTELTEDTSEDDTDVELYPDEFNELLAAFKKDGSFYDPLMGFPLFEGYAPTGHPYPLAFARGAAPELNTNVTGRTQERWEARQRRLGARGIENRPSVTI